MKSIKLIGLLALFALGCQGLELLKVEKDLFKGGLHRELVTNVTVKIDSQEEMDTCSLVFVENVTKDTYIYYEEVKGLDGFQFWPHTPIDIERPSSASIDHQFIWRLPLSSTTSTNSYIIYIEVIIYSLAKSCKLLFLRLPRMA